MLRGDRGAHAPFSATTTPRGRYEPARRKGRLVTTITTATPDIDRRRRTSGIVLWVRRRGAVPASRPTSGQQAGNPSTMNTHSVPARVKTSIGIWIALGLVTIAAALWLMSGVASAEPMEDGTWLSVPDGGVTVSITAGGEHACALRTTGEAACWGRNDRDPGQGQVPGQFVQLSAGRSHTCGVNSSGTVNCWGPTRPRPDGSSKRVVPEGQFRRHPHLRNRDDGDDCLLGPQQLLPGEPSARALSRRERRRRLHVRDSHRQWHSRVLGQGRLRPNVPAGRRVRPGERRRFPCLRPANRRPPHLLGQQLLRPVLLSGR